MDAMDSQERYPLDLDDGTWIALRMDELYAEGKTWAEIGRQLFAEECGRKTARRKCDEERAERARRTGRRRQGALPLVQRIGRRIAAERVYARRRQADLASAVGMSQGVLSAIERGKRRVSAAELVLLSDELDRPVEAFVPDD